jgi:hypothetical protein
MGKAGKSSSGKTNNTAQKEINADDFDTLLNSSANKKLDNNAPSLPIEMEWKVDHHNSPLEFEEAKDDTPDTPSGATEDDMSDDDIEDVEAAFNFTDTDFDVNNRDDYTLDPEVMKANAKGTLQSIAEVDEESEQTIFRKRVAFEIMNIENRLKEMEITQKSKWNLCVQIAGEKSARACYDFV